MYKQLTAHITNADGTHPNRIYNVRRDDDRQQQRQEIEGEKKSIVQVKINSNVERKEEY